MGGARKKRGAASGPSSVTEVAALAEEKPGATAVLKSLSNIQPDELQHILDDIEIEMNNRAKRLRLEAENSALSLQNAFHVELMKIPKSVRSMSLREFSEEYGEDIRTVMRSAVEAMTVSTSGGGGGAAGGRAPVTGTVVKAPAPGTDRATRTRGARSSQRSTGSTSSKASSSSSAVAQTPAGGRTTRSGRGVVRGAQTPMMKFDPRLPTTPGIRAPRYGESILSINGSPLAVPLAVTEGAPKDDSENASSIARAALGSGATSPTLTLEIPTGDGTAVDILRDPSALASMGEDMKADVASKIERLQSGLAFVLQHIGVGSLFAGGGGGAAAKAGDKGGADGKSN